jgi:hypothetical protein
MPASDVLNEWVSVARFVMHHTLGDNMACMKFVGNDVHEWF